MMSHPGFKPGGSLTLPARVFASSGPLFSRHRFHAPCSTGLLRAGHAAGAEPLCGSGWPHRWARPEGLQELRRRPRPPGARRRSRALRGQAPCIYLPVTRHRIVLNTPALKLER